MLKTAIIESNISSEEFAENDAVEETIRISSDLWMVKTENTEDEGWLFVDFHDDRFWIIYSMGNSNFFNIAIDEILRSEGGGLDRLWIPAGQVEEIGKMGEYEGIKISFGADDVFPEEFIEDNLEFTDLNIDGSGQSSRHLFEILKSTDEIDDFLALSRIQIRREVDGEFVRERVTNEGTFTTRGGSDASLHIATVERIKDQYSNLLETIEDNHIIGAKEQDHGGRSQGSPIVIRFSKPVPDVEEFLSYVVNARDPFRLWGHTRQIGHESYKVDGVDAHNGDKIAIEMSSEWIRLYLYEGACGNTALRIFTNIQQYYDPAAELVIADA
ncbi:hypothetical protein [Natrinema saccharevitans]|nr:hypothetical protein [Natrinema saccharevitans]